MGLVAFQHKEMQRDSPEKSGHFLCLAFKHEIQYLPVSYVNFFVLEHIVNPGYTIRNVPESGRYSIIGDI